ncbi:MAG: hypothetical protein IKG47_10885 [Oscillospiraceae bacterium]|nr:hypothetical protein [Oscillospiraceae bacterium]
MKYLFSLLINSAAFIVLINALIYIGCIVMKRPFSFDYLYNIVVPVIFGIAATEARNRKKK